MFSNPFRISYEIERLESMWPELRERGEIGIHKGLKILRVYPHEGSIPSAPTTKYRIAKGPYGKYKTFVSVDELLKYTKEVGIIQVEEDKKDDSEWQAKRALIKEILDMKDKMIMPPRRAYPKPRDFYSFDIEKAMEPLSPPKGFFDDFGLVPFAPWKFPTIHPARIPSPRELYDQKDYEVVRLNTDFPLMPIALEIWSYLSDAPPPFERVIWADRGYGIYGTWEQQGRTIHVCYKSNMSEQFAHVKNIRDLDEVDPFWTIVHEIVHALYPYREHDSLFERGFEWAKQKLWAAMM